MQAYLALGSNTGDRYENLNRAVWAISLLPKTKIFAMSHIYETKPVGFLPQGNFYNAVLRVDTGLSPHALLGACLGIEAGLGRIRHGIVKNGPRSIDIDILKCEDFECDEPELMLPHPRMNERAFVIVPLYDIIRDKETKAVYD